ncbi:hypothetical protein, partial [Nocardioides sp. AE5]|uniref:hypothetical protein n=1 Tax=Nocardioides sp. AE5 TaxID=2962573 RepID=UPI0028814B2E
MAHRLPGRPAWILAALLALTGMAACSDDEPFAYSSSAQAPDDAAYADQSSDTEPRVGDGKVELQMDSGATLVMWIDPDDIRKVYVQHSDPEDDQAWT